MQKKRCIKMHLFFYKSNKNNHAIAVNEEQHPENDPPEELLATLPAVSPPRYAIRLEELKYDATLPAVSPPLVVENNTTGEPDPFIFNKET